MFRLVFLYTLIFAVSLSLVPAVFAQQASIIYNADTNTIEVRGTGSVVSLTTIDKALDNDNLLEKLGSAEWLLKANLKAYEQVRLELHGSKARGDVDWLKLRSDPGGFVIVEGSNAQISIRDTRITSWDTATGNFDTAFADGSRRAYISNKNRNSRYTDTRMDVINSEIAYLGFFDETAYGISWKVISEPEKGDTGILGRGITGTVTNSKFHHNYFGLYVWGAGDMDVRNNEFYDNYGYGFDAHTVTQRTIVEDNYAHHNGLHGIIFADRCTENIVRRNVSVNNDGHGIMLHEMSDNNIIEDNQVEGNEDGIAIFESSNNLVRGNTVRNNVTGIRVYGREHDSSANRFQDNEISGSSSYGVYLYDAATGNLFQDNRILSSQASGVYLKSVSDNRFAANVIERNEDGIRIDLARTGRVSRDNLFEGNTIRDNRGYGLYSYASSGANTLEDNQFAGNGIADVYYPTPLEGITRGGVFLIVRLVVIAVIVIAALITLVTILRQRRQRAR